MQELAFGRFPFFVLSHNQAGVEPEQTAGLPKPSDRLGIEILPCNGKRCALVFSSVGLASQYLKASKQPTKFAVAIENSHDFVSVFGPLLDAGVSHALLDFVGDGPATMVSTELLLGTMREAVNNDLRSASTPPGILPDRRRI